ncbi:MAG: phosphodiesterase [Candidatus Tectomicrobia bacterium]|uniref:Phosphodiesterase n=1 Tax=Tectimicrobiota bacterium TaxID=2528274 RepID=A0A937VZ64_UNCTE|nr:phosphodiesterase [Candidatus Tectomicrobia bacterium]
MNQQDLKNTAAQADFCFVHFTDTHIMAGGPWSRMDTTASLQQVVEVLQALEPRPAFAVIGGDLVSPDMLDRDRILTQTEYEPSYHLLQDILRPLPYPTYMLLGNHDHRSAFHQVMQTPVPSLETTHHYSFDCQGYHFVALDTHQPGEHAGALDSAQLGWLQDDLAAHRGQPTLVFMHHHPWPLGLAWMDEMRLRNGEALVDILRQYPDVRWMICGHVHLDQSIQRDGLTMLTTPSTCFQVSKVSQARKSLPGPPGFRVVYIKGHEFSTRVLHLHGAGIADL